MKKYKVIGIGGNCWCNAILHRIKSEEIDYITSHLYNIRFHKGMELVLDSFNGNYCKEIYHMTPQKIHKEKWEKYPQDKNGDFKFVFPNYTLIHNNYDDTFLLKNKEKYKNFLSFYKSHLTKNNHLFFYALNKYDMIKNKEEIEEIKNKISKYININNFYILGSIPNKAKSPWCFNSKLYKEVFGNNYIELYPSDSFEICAETLKNFIINIKI